LILIMICLAIRWFLIIASISASSYYHVSAYVPMKSRASNRRSAINEIVSSTAALLICTKTRAARAVAPFAPVDALLPAARVKIVIDRSVDIASNLVAEEDADARIGMLHDLESLLLKPQNFNRGAAPIDVPQRPAKSYLNAYAEYRNRASVLEKPGAMLVQNGEIDAWRRLKRQERAREEADEVRAALNYYTSNLNFNPDRFVLTGTKEERSKLIRENSVPDIKTVIASDMGLRYLLRNDILTACDDARAELRYQMKQSTADGRDLLELLLSAQKALKKWFDLIDEKDALVAMDIVSQET